MTKTIKGPQIGNRQIRIELDSEQIFPNDPGQGTPAMVILTEGTRKREIASATFNCASQEGEIEGYHLDDAQANWLNTQIGVVDDFITRNTPST